ncbi:MAG: hypothetical protein QME65_02895 [Candidatus Omnitrophota bacterium]|nr:hypothetical protein [Candidatus Omnitrophota bacterium]
MNNEKKEVKKKGFFARIFDKLDKKIEAKAKEGKSCCCGPADNNKNSCCS